MEVKEASFKILMFPWLAHGHISPFLELAKRISNTKNFQIYLCSTAINFDSINNFIEKNMLNNSIRLVELHLEPHPELPPYFHTTKNLPSDLVSTLVKALQMSNSSFSDIVNILNPHLVIYDFFQPWAAKIAASKGIPAVYFSVYGAAVLSFVHNRYTYGKTSFRFPEIHVQEFELESLMSTFEFLYANIFEVDQDFLFGNFKHSCEFVIVKASEGIEGKYIGYLSSQCNKRIAPVGPLVDDKNVDGDSEIIQWLSKKSHHSTVYISFGSEHFLSKEEIEEIAKGLELCDVNFLWIIRFPMGAMVTLDSVLPRGFLDRVTERGRVVTGWAPQKDILANPSTGGFVSHCGWNSIMESMYFAVPVIAMPLKVDQPINAKMLVEAGSCVEVPRYENKAFKGDDIAKAIQEVIFKGEGLRHRAKKLSETMKMEEDGDIDEVSEMLWQICSKIGSNI